MKRPIKDLSGQICGWADDAKCIELTICDKAEADAVIVPHHYSGKVTKNSFASFLVTWFGKVHGAIQLGYGIRPKEKEDADGTREFDRMWLSDEMPKFSETIVISLLIRTIRHRFPEIRRLISYADTSAGNKGTIYRAANFRFDAAIKADFYILATGERVHPVSMYHRHGSRAWGLLESLYPGIKKADGKQLRFIYDLNTAGGSQRQCVLESN